MANRRTVLTSLAAPVKAEGDDAVASLTALDTDLKKYAAASGSGVSMTGGRIR